MRWLAILFAVVAAGCATKLGRDGSTQSSVDIKFLAKSDVDRIADTTRTEVVNGLMLIADKLYKRNPREWKKGGAASREAAVQRLRQRISRNWPELAGQRERRAATLAFTAGYEGDRVAALMFGLLTMVDAAYEHKQEFYILDSLNETKLYNCARNMEIAMWKLGADRNPAGELYLLSNELDPANRNISFEREFGRITALLDLMAKVVADRNGRALSRVSQSVATMIFLPVGF
jgi:hypothetical protein